MQIRNVVIDCADLDASGALLGSGDRAMRGRGANEYVVVLSPSCAGAVRICCLQKVPEPKVGKSRCHIDLQAEGETEAEIARLEGLGATRGESFDYGVQWTVMSDPEGTEFCVTHRQEVRSGRSRERRSRPTGRGDTCRELNNGSLGAETDWQVRSRSARRRFRELRCGHTARPSRVHVPPHREPIREGVPACELCRRSGVLVAGGCSVPTAAKTPVRRRAERQAARPSATRAPLLAELQDGDALAQGYTQNYTVAPIGRS